ncbi:MAG: hypothetical protein JWN13_5953 [Betaproteobacteria bacterium]|nr:hypothetical protein [Betaproteobacteria bacterium]
MLSAPVDVFLLFSGVLLLVVLAGCLPAIVRCWHIINKLDGTDRDQREPSIAETLAGRSESATPTLGASRVKTTDTSEHTIPSRNAR